MALRDSVPGIGERLRKARESKGLTFRQAGELASVSFGTLTKYEADTKTPGIAVLRRLAKAYGVTTCELIPEIVDEPKPTNPRAKSPDEKPTAKPLRPRVDALLSARGWTEKQLDNRLNWRSGKLGEVLSSRKPVKPELISEIAAVFEITPAELLNDAPEPEVEPVKSSKAKGKKS